jgi:hypothetical protein
MTNEERAEKIFRVIKETDFEHIYSCEAIAAALKDYADERVKEAVIDNKIFDYVKRVARSSALEEAAKVAEKQNDEKFGNDLFTRFNCAWSIRSLINPAPTIAQELAAQDGEIPHDPMMDGGLNA